MNALEHKLFILKAFLTINAYIFCVDDNLCKQFGSRSCPIKMQGLIWIRLDTLMHEIRINFFIEISINPYKPSVLFVGHRQTAQTRSDAK